VSSSPLVYVDFQNADAQGRVRLNCVGTVNDLSSNQVQLSEGLKLNLYTDDADEHGNAIRLSVEGAVTFSPEEAFWVAVIDWEKIQREPVLATESQPTSDQIRLRGVPGSGNIAPLPQNQPAGR
jgi:hypothetical protein